MFVVYLIAGIVTLLYQVQKNLEITCVATLLMLILKKYVYIYKYYIITIIYNKSIIILVINMIKTRKNFLQVHSSYTLCY